MHVYSLLECFYNYLQQEELILTKTDLKQNGSVDRNEDLILSLKAQVSELQDEKEALLTEKAELDHMLMQMVSNSLKH